jgi:hypothetical protein
MKNLLLVAILILANLGTGLAQKASRSSKTKVAVAFFDEKRLRSTTGEATLANFKFFFPLIQEIVVRDFPGVELRVLQQGELLHLPDGTGLNLETLQPEMGYVLSAKGKKRVILSGIQSDTDFACAAAAFFRRSSAACLK